jgi:hypothetical protein
MFTQMSKPRDTRFADFQRHNHDGSARNPAEVYSHLAYCAPTTVDALLLASIFDTLFLPAQTHASYLKHAFPRLLYIVLTMFIIIKISLTLQMSIHYLVPSQLLVPQRLRYSYSIIVTYSPLFVLKLWRSAESGTSLCRSFAVACR